MSRPALRYFVDLLTRTVRAGLPAPAGRCGGRPIGPPPRPPIAPRLEALRDRPLPPPRANGASVLSSLSMNSHSFDNAGSAVFAPTASALTLGNGAVINNLAGATFDVRAGTGTIVISASGYAVFNNAGTLLKSNSGAFN